MRRANVFTAVLAGCLLATAGCGSTTSSPAASGPAASGPSSSMTPSTDDDSPAGVDTPGGAGGYVDSMESVCRSANTELDALPVPPDQIPIGDFAVEVGRIVQNESDSFRAIDPPPELEGDHRAFIANTDQQAERWQEMGALAAGDQLTTDELARLRTSIGELTLGRDDLAIELGIDGCARGA